MSNNYSRLIGEPVDTDDDLPPDEAQRAWYRELIQERQSRMTFAQQTTTPPRYQPGIVMSRIPLSATDTPQGPIIEGEPRLASFRKKAERANLWVTGSSDVVDLLTGYSNLPGNLEAAHAAPRDTGYTNWTTNRSVESILGLPPASLHYDTILNGFMLFVHVHKLYDNGYAFILPIFSVIRQMWEITLIVGDKFQDYQVRLEAARSSTNFNDAVWRQEELTLRLWARSQWQAFDDNHARNGTYYRVLPTTSAFSERYARETPITQLRPEKDGGPIIAQFPWHDLQPFLCHVHPRFFMIDSIFKVLDAPFSTSFEDLTTFLALKQLWRLWVLPPTAYFNDDALDVLEDRQTKMQSRLRPVIRPSLPKLVFIPSTPSGPSFPAAPRNQRMAEDVFLDTKEDDTEPRDDGHHEEDMGIEVEGSDLLGEADTDVGQTDRFSSPDELDSIF